MKKQSIIHFLVLSVLFFVSTTCTHNDESDMVVPGPQIEYGDLQISQDAGWGFDKAHSNITWETAYLGSAALLTGRFNSFSIDLNFVEDDPSKISIVGKVVLSSVNTGEPGRDGGCLLKTFGTDVNDEAVFTSTSVEFDGAGGYIVNGNLDFHGETSAVVMKLKLAGTEFFPADSGMSGAPFTVAGLSGEFEFLAKTTHGIVSSSISDLVRIKINAQFKKSGE